MHSFLVATYMRPSLAENAFLGLQNCKIMNASSLLYHCLYSAYFIKFFTCSQLGTVLVDFLCSRFKNRILCISCLVHSFPLQHIAQSVAETHYRMIFRVRRWKSCSTLQGALDLKHRKVYSQKTILQINEGT